MITKDISVEQELTKDTILKDYQLACESREASLIGRKEVFMGKAKFGIFGDGKEVAQLAMAQAFRPGDFRSGYYRDQTFMFAIGELTMEQYFAQLYAHTSVEAEPVSAGRMMNGHFGTRLLDDEGKWKNQSNAYNASADISPTAGQMPRILGIAYASKLYRQNPDLQVFTDFSDQGNEISFGTIGNASTSEGLFYETINAAGVLQVPMLMSVWDDEYGISVPKEYHTTKGSISKVLAGFKRTKKEQGYEIFTVKGWDYEALFETYQKAAEICRTEHVPVLVHVIEVTQPQGHSTSGSHERYKPKDRLEWEKEFDCIKKMREWIVTQGYASNDEVDTIEKTAKTNAKNARKTAWNAFVDSMKGDHNEALQLLTQLAQNSPNYADKLSEIQDDLQKTTNPLKRDAITSVKKALRLIRTEQNPAKHSLIAWLDKVIAKGREDYSSHLYSQSDESALNIPEIPAQYNEDSKLVDGREVLQACFDAALTRDPRVFAFGEDVGKIGDVNQAFAGLQEKHGELRVTDTGIREATIIGQGIGAAMRGLRPIAEIQYLDYIYYAVQILADDLSCLQYRTKGGQKSPLIIRTRGHRLEGIWHTGSPMGALLHSLRGIYILTPRDMTQAAGFYNTLLKSDDPALVVECLNGYRLKEKLPENIGDFTVPLGVPETLKEGTDITLVTYGSMCRIVIDAARQLEEVGVSCEVIDVQSLLPFDLQHHIVESIKKTNRALFIDEDVPGGASAFMMQKVIEEQNAYRWLDSAPATLAAQEHRAAYGSDGDFFSKPSIEDVFDKVYDMMSEADPAQYPAIY
ncbi:alpha-ketoacid dehydrogenase subunit alpha/beta [Microscilla marina]|uniref:3-methyl-2-oxobutanoate dehydrogenase (2-methylpropanoyl-transferring) n=1 Tax=Microscilla marina ATCC 23134 TaxID=313606 RepID=A1ZGW0_MICM2|nr:alpha-ketoacid dehydrogenase subunit alpha/beta [Microscilla marina]EAY30229.1 (pyruvate) Oxoisovalerate Dehydrogenase Alpha and Beta Fusion, putative [Microscilla marina ATCC 23134]